MRQLKSHDGYQNFKNLPNMRTKNHKSIIFPMNFLLSLFYYLILLNLIAHSYPIHL
ncbi:hypothetical protein Lalb_Chr21g0311251 [Lupinus albus]|uniref:Uncharacterized protein n=1 Tax=Lupinus albus TaxID=3870 RepID=A0A6A4NCH3_LUPAL|nr:hypothetical protein Lalb_Chr21g0311251 [Lupinus albus]